MFTSSNQDITEERCSMQSPFDHCRRRSDGHTGKVKIRGLTQQ
jgi:hypothetical protein